MTKYERYAIAMKHAKKFAADKKTSRPILRGVHHAPNGEIWVTDAVRAMIVKDAHSHDEQFTLDADTSAPIDGVYPDLTRVIPTEFKTEITLFNAPKHAKETLDDWIDAAKVATAIGDKKMPIAKISVHDGKVKLIVNNTRAFYEHDPLFTKINGDDSYVSFNAKFLLDALNLVKDFNPLEVTLGLNGANSPFALSTDNGVIAVIVPVRSE